MQNVRVVSDRYSNQSVRSGYEQSVCETQLVDDCDQNKVCEGVVKQENKQVPLDSTTKCTTRAFKEKIEGGRSCHLEATTPAQNK